MLPRATGFRPIAGLAQVQEPECAPAVKREAEEDWGLFTRVMEHEKWRELERCATLECVEGKDPALIPRLIPEIV